MRDELIGSLEASRIVGVSYPTFLRWVADGRIEPAHVMPGVTGAKLFRLADVERLARSWNPARALPASEQAGA
jgi:hypothetical protein